MGNQTKLVLFDWNGTLLDDTPIFWEAVRATFSAFGVEPPTMEEYFRELDGDYLDSYRARGITALREELNAVYEPYYEEHVGTVELSGGALKTLQALRDGGVMRGLVTLQKESLTRPLMKQFDIDGFFLYHAFHALKKDEAIRAILAQAGADPRDCFFVGDTPSDIRHANRAGVHSVAFVNGHVPGDLISLADPDFAIRDMRELLHIVEHGSYPGVLCDGCNVLGNAEHRCHQGDIHILVRGRPAGQACSCQVCGTSYRIFEF